ncbi:MAG: hypothetical protein WC011_02165 [Candidatus Paceibacterota bacterium]
MDDNNIFEIILSLYESDNQDNSSLKLEYETMDSVFNSAEEVYKEIVRHISRNNDVKTYQKITSEPEKTLIKEWLNQFLINLRRRLVSEYLFDLDQKGTRNILSSEAFVYK